MGFWVRGPVHFLIRYSDKLRNVDTFAEHLALLSKLGYVWFGKFGQGLSTEMVDKALDQIQQGTPTYLYLAVEGAVRYRATILDIRSAGRSRNDRVLTPDPAATPEYYRNEACAAWYKIKDLAAISSVEAFSLATYSDPKSTGIKFNGAWNLIYVRRGAS